MSEEKRIATREEPPPQDKAVAELSKNEVQIIRDTYAKDATPAEFNVYMAICRHCNLNPFKGQVHFIKYGGEMAVVTGIYGLLKTAENSGNYRGHTNYQWCGTDGKWVEVWTKDELPYAARVGVYRKDNDIPVMGIVYWKERASYYQPKDKQGNPVGEPVLKKMWKSDPLRMLAKCALAQAIREACPDVDGIYIAEEMGTTIEALERKPQGFNQNQGPPATGGGDEVMNFGKKFKGMKFSELPDDYLKWAEEKMEKGPNKDRLMQEKERRAHPEPLDLKDETQDAEFEDENGRDKPPSLWDEIAGFEKQLNEKQIAAIQKNVCKTCKVEAIDEKASPEAVRYYWQLLKSSAGGE